MISFETISFADCGKGLMIPYRFTLSVLEMLFNGIPNLHINAGTLLDSFTNANGFSFRQSIPMLSR